MSLSISNSEEADRAIWRRWIVGFVSTWAFISLMLLAIVVVFDPFSTGRLTPITRIDFVGDKHYADAARIRVLSFEGAIFGNSHVLRIDPENLTRLTGRRFVSLALEATGPQEHMFLMRMFDRERRVGSYVLILGMDDLTCMPKKLPDQPGGLIPQWLYDGSDFTYLSHILSTYALRMTIRRITILLGWQGGEPPDGYVFEPTIKLNPGRLLEVFARPQPADAPPPDAPFPYLDDLEQTVKSLNRDDVVLLVFMPVYWNQLPVAGSQADARMAACKARADAIARLLPRGAMLDLRIDGPKVRDRANFFDPTHYKDEITRDIEAAIAQRINSLSTAPSG